ncbi:cell division protein FtsA [Prolixibacter bellariivorans]|nr:cell division protein FtsA [Prolixibacter bellariivorans]
MSSMKEMTAAVDIGTAKTTAIIGRYTIDRKLEVVGYGSTDTRGVRNGVVVNIEEAGQSIREAVDAACRGLKLKVRAIYAGLSGQKIRTRSASGYRMIDKDGEVTRELVSSLYEEVGRYSLQPGEKIFHVVPQEFIVDGEMGIQQPVGMAGNRIDAMFNLILAPDSYRINLRRSAEKAGFELAGVFVNPFVQGEAYLTEDEKEAGVVLVDFGAGTTGISVYYENRLRLAAELPFGGAVVTRDIKEGCNIIARHAELLKVQFGRALAELAPDNKVVQIPESDGWPAKEVSFKNLSHIIQARMEEILEGISFQIESTGLMHKLGAGIVITGGGAGMAELEKLISYKTGLDVRFGRPVIPMKELLFAEQVNGPEAANILGLLVKGLKKREGMRNPDTMVIHESEEEERPQNPRQQHRPNGNGFKGVFNNLFEKARDGLGNLISDEDMEMN